MTRTQMLIIAGLLLSTAAFILIAISPRGGMRDDD